MNIVPKAATIIAIAIAIAMTMTTPAEGPPATAPAPGTPPAGFGAIYDTTAAAIARWDGTFRPPPVVRYDGTERIDGYTLEADSAAYYNKKIYISAGAFDGNIHYIIAHELGHAWEAHLGDYAPTTEGSELFADCIAGAAAAAAGYDYRAMAGYTGGFTSSDNTHGTSRERSAAVLAGAAHGHRSCEAEHL